VLSRRFCPISSFCCDPLAHLLAPRSPEIGLLEVRDLLGMCALLYEPKTSLIVELKYPRKWAVEHMGKVLLTHLCRSKVESYVRAGPHEVLPERQDPNHANDTLCFRKGQDQAGERAPFVRRCNQADFQAEEADTRSSSLGLLRIGETEADAQAEVAGAGRWIASGALRCNVGESLSHGVTFHFNRIIQTIMSHVLFSQGYVASQSDGPTFDWRR
jgi:hypothetical protein